MGLFSFFKKSPEKTEAAGDAYVNANQFGSAKIEYESALAMIEKKQPEDTAAKERVLEKLQASKESLARLHYESGKKLVEANVMDEAGNLLALALSLTADPDLKKTLKEMLSQTVTGLPEVECEDDFDDETVEAPRDESVLETDKEPEDEDVDHAFEVLCMTLPDEIADAYQSYGENFKEGYLALSHGEFRHAAEKFQLALDEHPGSHIPMELATALINLGQTDSAIEHLTAYLHTYPTSFHGISLICDIYCDLDNFDAAHDVLKRLPEDMRESSDILRLTGRIYYQERNYEKAEEIFKEALTATEHDTDVARELAMTLAAAGKTSEARDMYAGLLNECARCRQRLNPLDKKAFADLAFQLDDASDKILDIYLTLGKDHEELRADCYIKASAIFSVQGNEREAARFKKMAEAAGRF